jgi:hypothetical protein
MKPTLRAVLALALAAAMGRAGASEYEDAQREIRKAGVRKANVTVELRCLSLPQTLAIPLVQRLRSAQAEVKAAALAGLDELLTGRQATLLAWSMLTVQDGGQAGTSAAEDVPRARYYEPGSVAVCLTDKPSEPRREPGVITAPSVGYADTQRLGASLDFEAKILPGGKSLDLRFSMQLIRWMGLERWSVEHERTTEKRLDRMVVEQPHVAKVARFCELTLESGEQRLVQVAADPSAEGRLILCIVCATIGPKP